MREYDQSWTERDKIGEHCRKLDKTAKKEPLFGRFYVRFLGSCTVFFRVSAACKS